jgi:hypothetical protein
MLIIDRPTVSSSPRSLLAEEMNSSPPSCGGKIDVTESLLTPPTCLAETERNTSRSTTIVFNDERNHTLVFESEHDVPIEEIWFTGDDYAHMKARLREESRAWRRQGYGMLIKDTFDPSFPNAQEYLNAFAQLEGALCRRGAERHLSRQHAEERSDQKDRARQAVLIQQGKLRRKRVDPDTFVERLAQVYKDQSRPAVVFARRLGIADQHVELHGEDSSIACMLAGIDLSGEGTKRRNYERRNSNMSMMSTNSMDSRRQWGRSAVAKGKHCPASPSTPLDEYYAAIA